MIDDPNVRLGIRIRELRKQRGMTQKELAEASRTSQGYITRIESGRHTMTMAVLTRIATALNTEIGFIEK